MKINLLIIVFLFGITKAYTQISPVGSYDSCGAAITLTVNTTCVPGVNTYTTTGATKSPQTGVGISHDDDVWFKFTTLAGQTSAQIQILNDVGGMGNYMEIWTSCNAVNSIADWGGNTFNVSSLTPNTTYYIRVYTNGTFATLSTFQICVVDNTPPPAFPNNECAYATAIPVSNNPTTCTAVPITNMNATASANPPSCLSVDYRDIWIKFTPSSTTQISYTLSNYSIITGSGTPGFYAAVYSGSCGSLTLINCSTVSTFNDNILAGTYTSGITYYIRLICPIANQGNFEVCMKEISTAATYPISADSTCTKAIPINSSINQSSTYTEGSTNGIKVISQLACYGYNAPNALAWYSFTVPADGMYLVDFKDFVRLGLNQNGAGFRILKRTSCYTTGTDTIITKPPAGTYDTIACINSILNDNQTVSLLANTQYYLTVMENSYNGGRVSYKVRVIGTTLPSNDESTGATTIVQDVTCVAGNNATTTQFSTLSNSPNPNVLPGSSSFTQDVWYKFTASTSIANIIVSRQSAVTRIVVYENDASTIKYDPVSNSSSIQINALTIGNTYYIRIINTSGTPVGLKAAFTICVFGPASSIAASVSSCTAADASKTSTNSGAWLDFTLAGRKILSVFDGPAYTGASFTPRGNINVQYFTSSGGLRLNAGTAVLDRNFEISDGGNNFSNSPVKVRFYFTIEEFNLLVADAASGGISAPFELRVYRIPGANCTSTIPSNGLYYNIVGTGYISDPSAPYIPLGYYIDMITPNFSGFFLQHADNSVLPAICGNFNYQINNNKVIISLSTLTENNVANFKIQRSDDKVNFNTVTTLTANNNTSGSNYQFIDEDIIHGKTYYYRVLQTDKDGKEQFICKTISLKLNSKTVQFSKAYPNPVKNEFIIDILKPISGKVDIQITNMIGQVVHHQSNNILQYDTKLKIKANLLKAGIYSVSIITNNGKETQQILKL